MKNSFFTEQALPLPTGRISRFARRHAYAVSPTSKGAHIRASHYANSVASASASFPASPAANHAASLMLHHT
jgi:hypothetical protein